MFLPEDDGAYRLSLISKTIHEVISASSRRLCVQVDALNDRTAGKLVQRNLKPTKLLLASEKRIIPQMSPLKQLFSCCWTQLRLMRVRNVTVPSELLQLLPRACPQLQELFLEEVCVASDATRSMPPGHPKRSEIVDPQLQQVAADLSQLQHLELLRMDWEHAECVMWQLCKVLKLVPTRKYLGALPSGSSRSSHQPLLLDVPLLGWYLFLGARGTHPTSSSTSSSTSSGSSNLGSSSSNGSSSSSLLHSTSDISCSMPGPCSGAATAAAAADGDSSVDADGDLPPAAAAAAAAISLCRSGSIGRRSLDLQRSLPSINSGSSGTSGSSGNSNLAGPIDTSSSDFKSELLEGTACDSISSIDDLICRQGSKASAAFCHGPGHSPLEVEGDNCNADRSRNVVIAVKRGGSPVKLEICSTPVDPVDDVRKAGSPGSHTWGLPQLLELAERSRQGSTPDGCSVIDSDNDSINDCVSDGGHSTCSTSGPSTSARSCAAVGFGQPAGEGGLGPALEGLACSGSSCGKQQQQQQQQCRQVRTLEELSHVPGGGCSRWQPEQQLRQQQQQQQQRCGSSGEKASTSSSLLAVDAEAVRDQE
jgi:hypothetical protein